MVKREKVRGKREKGKEKVVVTEPVVVTREKVKEKREEGGG